MRRRGLTVMAILSLAGGAATALGQWSSNPSVNLPVATGPNEQIQPKIAAGPDGSVSIAWFDNATGGYDVYVQRYDIRGYAQWDPRGLLIADRAVSSTVDYDLEVDSLGNTIIAFNDDGGVSGATQQIVVQAITRGGQRFFPGSGLPLTTGSGFRANPKIAVLSDGSWAIGWTGSNSVNVRQVFASFPPLPPFGAGPVVTVPNSSNLYQGLSDLVASSDGDWIAMWVQGTTSSPITSTRTLRAERYDPQSPGWAWTATTVGVPIGVATSIQNGYFPRAVGDGSGGITAAWYEIGGARGAFVQRLDVGGLAQFAAPLAVPLAPGRIALGAELGTCCAGQSNWSSLHVITPTSAASPQGNFGVVATRWFDLGLPSFGSTSAEVVAPGGVVNPPRVTTVSALDPAGPIIFSVTDSAAGSPVNTITAYLLDPSSLGVIGTPRTVANAPGSRGRVTAASAGRAQVVFAFESGTPADIFAQNLRPDGSLGFCYANCDLSLTVPVLNALDFACYLAEFQRSNPYANCDGSTGAPVLNALDFACFLARFQQGCP